MSQPFIDRLRLWRENPIQFVRDQFQVEPDVWQAELLNAFASHSPDRIRIALKACTGPGKTAGLAWCGWNFMGCYGEPGEHPKGFAVSITGDNLKDNLWPELAKWRGRSLYLTEFFEWSKERIYCKQYPADWFMSARSFAKTANVEEQGQVLSGLHGKYTLVLIDESGGIGVAVMKSAEQSLGQADGGFHKIIQAGNPTTKKGMLYAASSKLAEQWHTISITGDPDDPARSPRIDIEKSRAAIKQWGRDDPWVMATILGQFPHTDINALIGIEEVEKAMKRSVRKDFFEHVQKRIGIDVSRFGPDSTILAPRQGLHAFNFAEMRGANTLQIAGRVAAAYSKWQSEMHFVDATGGFGAGVIDQLGDMGIPVTAVEFAGKPTNPRFANKRAEMWWEMIEWIKRGGVLPSNMPRIVQELTEITYSFDKYGRLILEDKEQLKKRLGFSPDAADALAMTFFMPDLPARGTMPMAASHGGNMSEHEWDPYHNRDVSEMEV